MQRYFLLGLTFLMLSIQPSFGQTTEEIEEDPFVNDPFFSRPFSEFFSSEESIQDDSSKTEVSSIHSESSKSSKSRSFVRRINNEGIDYGGYFESGPYASSNLYAAYPTMPMVHFNRVNGLFLGVRKERMQWYVHDPFLWITKIIPHGLIGYSFGREEWQYEAGLEKHFGKERRLLVGGELYNSTTTADYKRVGQLETTLTSLFAGYDYLDYYKQEGWGVYMLGRSYQFFEGGVSYNENRFSSLDVVTEYHMFGKNHHYRDNPPVDLLSGQAVDEINITSLSFSGAFNPKLLLLSPHFTFSIKGDLEISTPNIASTDYTYRKYTTELQTYINFEPGTVLKYRLLTGSITGDAPLIKEFQLGGPGTMRAFPYKSMPFGALSGNKMVLSTAELQFGSSFGYDDWLDFDDLYLSLFLDSGWVTDYTGVNNKPLDGFEDFEIAKFEHNGGVGLGTNSFRAELAWDLRNTDLSPILWIRFNPTF